MILCKRIVSLYHFYDSLLCCVHSIWKAREDPDRFNFCKKCPLPPSINATYNLCCKKHWVEDFENDMRCIITIISSKTINSLCVSVIYLFLFNPNSFYCVLPTAFPLIAVWFLLWLRENPLDQGLSSTRPIRIKICILDPVCDQLDFFIT